MLRWLELESDSDDQSPQDDGAFAMRLTARQVLWLVRVREDTRREGDWITSASSW